MNGRDRAVGLSLVLVFAVVVGLSLANRPPLVPANAASATLDRTVMTDGHGQRCLDRAALGSGWADVCWAVDRIPDGDDNTQDYYQLRVYGSFQGVRWLVTRADLVGSPDGGAYMSWPDFAIEGPCHDVTVHLGPAIGPEPTESVCGRTEGAVDLYQWVQTATWTCEQCLFPDGGTKPLSMYAQIAVKAGTVPEWDVAVGGGS